MAESGIRLRTSLPPGEPYLVPRAADPCAAVIFGATGDLTRRKLIPALFALARERALPRAFAIVGVSRSVGTDDALRATLRGSLAAAAAAAPFDARAWDAFAPALTTVAGDLDDPATYARLRLKLAQVDAARGTAGNRLFYCAVPPDAVPAILRGLHAAGLVPASPGRPWTRVVVEKPFGRDLASAGELNRLAAEVLAEDQVWRIDHYLGKETVQNILVFRFGNSIFEPLWNRKYIDHVEITAAEAIGLEGRGAFYDRAGVLRDVVQNHLLQLLALIAMEQPVSFRPDEIRDEKAKVLRALRPWNAPDIAARAVRGQYRGYRDEPGVAPASRTPTYAALAVALDNWRWQGVPFYLRAGKRLRRRLTEVSIHFQSIPTCLFGRDDVCQLVQPNVLCLRIQPDEGIGMHFVTKAPGDELAIADVAMDFDYAGAFARPAPEAYERLLLDALRGDATLFARRDEVELAWAFVDPVLRAWDEAADGPPEYEPGSDGPAAARALPAAEGRHWRPLT
ncbi:MAG: glucose-6-phosphate dehydrogenase [Candidatus Krumholzibacteriia bacterium]